MAHIIVKTETPARSLLPRDAVSISFALLPQGATSRDLVATSVAQELADFYATFAGNLSYGYLWGSTTIEFVDLEDDVPRTPYATKPIASIAGLTDAYYDLPSEVACCVSFRGDVGSGLNPRRRRGRVYIGPLATTGAAELDLVGASLKNQICTAWKVAMTNAGYQHCVYSRYTHHGVPVGRRIDEKDSGGNPIFPEIGSLLDDSFMPVTTYWTDNAWDIQRRRGIAATARFTLS